MRIAADIHVLAGDFASQQLAYAHLLDVADAEDLSPDLDHVEVIAGPLHKRLRAYFDDDLVSELARATDGEALILVLPGAFVTGAFPETSLLRDLGRHPGHVTRAALS
ncbi:hypothetical protein [uncultured Jannaschia sp.]|uniref:hypothetical protein n=1 Tax=uncultured Jannaschia sp. TaxID=293347 RepID=UPI00261DE99D|nr:hypothetical protein [uncultured Jannaschia sp.]